MRCQVLPLAWSALVAAPRQQLTGGVEALVCGCVMSLKAHSDSQVLTNWLDPHNSAQITSVIHSLFTTPKTISYLRAIPVCERLVDVCI